MVFARLNGRKHKEDRAVVIQQLLSCRSTENTSAALSCTIKFPHTVNAKYSLVFRLRFLSHFAMLGAIADGIFLTVSPKSFSPKHLVLAMRNSRLCTVASRAVKMSAATKTEPWRKPMRITVRGAIGARLSSKRHAPASTLGTIKKRHGNVPRSICQTFNFSIPEITAVGQSGPPQRTITLSMCKPGRDKIRSMATVPMLCTTTSC
mmetsp:Transcript_145087/g.263917  ORF Transcript_145087/g.263917 Transcript_145087/m.263917 type:complete len:206 (-) Transcript_145087:2750-3367(-)